MCVQNRISRKPSFSGSCKDHCEDHQIAETSPCPGRLKLATPRPLRVPHGPTPIGHRTKKSHPPPNWADSPKKRTFSFFSKKSKKNIFSKKIKISKSCTAKCGLFSDLLRVPGGCPRVFCGCPATFFKDHFSQWHFFIFLIFSFFLEKRTLCSFWAKFQ